MISGWEWVLILGIVAILIIWGPKKLPEIARAIGEAKREFEKSSKEFQEVPKRIISPESSVAVSEPSSDDILIMTARKLGISTEGKTKAQISEEIIEKAKATSQ